MLGGILGLVGFLRISRWSLVVPETYGPHWPLVAVTIWLSLSVSCSGHLAGSMLPLVLKKAGMDPAVSSAPFVATLVDVTGSSSTSRCAQLLRGTLSDRARAAIHLPFTAGVRTRTDALDR